MYLALVRDEIEIVCGISGLPSSCFLIPDRVSIIYCQLFLQMPVSYFHGPPHQWIEVLFADGSGVILEEAAVAFCIS